MGSKDTDMTSHLEGPREGAARPTRPAAWRLQVTLIALCAVALVFLITLYVLNPSIYTHMLGMEPAGEPHPPVVTAFLVAVVALVGVGIVGIARRWRWVFWLILVAFAASALQVPASALNLALGWPEHLPAWYALLRGLVAVGQVAMAGMDAANGADGGRVGHGPGARVARRGSGALPRQPRSTR